MTDDAKSKDRVDIQIIANLVVRNPAGEVLFVRYDPENEKWWLPGGDVAPFTHPDQTRDETLQDFATLEVSGSRLSFVESFRGRRGWHLVFHYDVRAQGEPVGLREAAWFPPESLPRSVHGQWEKSVVARVCGG
ncbi:MAG: hypothetical protein QNJ30_09540 [Kiloniellales bacterium]|nr:hypothetical protein [Kiloniellales bacterium]